MQDLRASADFPGLACRSEGTLRVMQTIGASARRSLVLLATLAAMVLVSCGGGPRTLEIDRGRLVYVAIGTSTVFAPSSSEGAIYVYRDLLAEDFGVEVDLRNHTAPGLPASTLLMNLQTNERLLEDLAAADVVTLHVPKTDWIVPYSESVQGTADCGGDDGQECWREALMIYRSRTEDIFAALTAVVDPSETLIRVQDEYMPFFRGTEADRMILSYWQEGEAYVAEVAAGHRIPVAGVLDAFHGPDGTDVPCDEDLLQSDCDHVTAEGARLMAELLHALGYELAE